MNPAKPIARDAPAAVAASPGGLFRWRRWLTPARGVAGALLLGTILLFWPAVHHPFMAIDDSEYVTDHPLVAQGLTWIGVAAAFTARHSGNWHPLTTLSHMLDCQLFGLNPAGHHAVNILLHAASAALVFAVWHGLTSALGRSALVAALFAWHPLRVESVAWISERKDVLSVFFFLLTLWAYARYVRSQSALRPPPSAIPSSPPRPRGPARWYAMALCCAMLGLMSKPMLVTLPFVLLLLDYWPLHRYRLADLHPRRAQWRRLWPVLREKLPFLALSLLVAFITTQVQQPAMAELRVLPVVTRVMNMFVAYSRYLAQTVWPFDLAVVYPYDLSPPGAAVGAAVLLVGAVTGLAWVWRAQRPWFTMGWLWFLGTLVPVIGLVQVGIQAHADRYTYLPSVGLLMLMVWAAAEIAERGGVHRPGALRTALAALTGLLLGGLVWRTRDQLTLWADTETLMRHTERVAGSSELVRGSLGGFYLQAGRLAEAERQYRLGLELDGDAWPSVVGLANVYAEQGKAAEAEQLFRRALAGRPSPAHHFALADFLHDQNRLDEARVHYLQGLARVPYHAGVRTRLGVLYAKQQNWPAARQQFERALRIHPKLVGAWYNLGRLEMLQGHPDAARTNFLRALTLQPAFAPAQYGLGLLLAAQGQLPEAIAHYQRALAVQPDLADAHLSLAEALARLGQFAPARAHFETALQLQTNSARAHLGLAGVLLAQQRPAEAVAQLQLARAADPDNPEPLNNLAWLRATHPDAALRDPAQAVQLASRAVELTRTNDAAVLDTLAAALARAGHFPQAMIAAGQALELAANTGQTHLWWAISNRLQLYRAGVPYQAEQ